eukprot:217869-Pyramimonas_sp.AAC.1
MFPPQHADYARPHPKVNLQTRRCSSRNEHRDSLARGSSRGFGVSATTCSTCRAFKLICRGSVQAMVLFLCVEIAPGMPDESQLNSVGGQYNHTGRDETHALLLESDRLARGTWRPRVGRGLSRRGLHFDRPTRRTRKASGRAGRGLARRELYSAAANARSESVGAGVGAWPTANFGRFGQFRLG